MKIHIWRHENPDSEKAGGRYICTNCNEGIKFYSYKEYVGHIGACKKNKKERVTCQMCSKTLLSQDSLDNHMRQRHDKSPVICITCGATFSGYRKEIRMQGHKIRTGHIEDKCTICPERITFSSWEEHLQHAEESHDGCVKVRCHKRSCNQLFNTKEALNGHLAKCLNAGTEFPMEEMEVITDYGDLKSWDNYPLTVCPECGDKVKKKKMFYHIQMKHGNDELMCSHCSRVFRTVLALKKHEQDFHDYVTCEHCKKVLQK